MDREYVSNGVTVVSKTADSTKEERERAIRNFQAALIKAVENKNEKEGGC